MTLLNIYHEESFFFCFFSRKKKKNMINALQKYCNDFNYIVYDILELHLRPFSF